MLSKSRPYIILSADRTGAPEAGRALRNLMGNRSDSHLVTLFWPSKKKVFYIFQGISPGEDFSLPSIGESYITSFH